MPLNEMPDSEFPEQTTAPLLHFFQVLSIIAINKSCRRTCALPLNLLKSMTKDIDLNVTQVGCDGTA